MIGTKHSRFIQIFLIIILLFQVASVGAEHGELYENEMPINKNINNKPQFVEGEYIVKYRDSIEQYENIKIYNREGISLIETFDEINTDLVKIKGSFNLNKKIERLEKNPKIEYIEPNYLYYPMGMSVNESRFEELWGLENTGQLINKTQGVPGVDIDILNAWENTMGKEDVTVAVIDTGIDPAHPDLKDRIWLNPNEVLNGEDSDGNGYVDDIHGWDFLNENNTVYNKKDGDFHGTHVAGIISASLNELGTVGVAPKVKVMPLKFLGMDEYGDTVGTLSNVLKAIDYAKDKGVKIVNASWGNYQDSKILEEAIDNSGMLFICASGNETLNIDVKPSYPASYKLPNILSVGAIDNQGDLGDFSNYGIESVHVAAPGVDILSTIPVTRYGAGAIFTERKNYKVLFQSFGLELIDKDEKRLDMMASIIDILEVAREDSILLVQDDESSNPKYKDCLEYYKDPLMDLGYENLDIYEVKQNEDGPICTEMKDYDLVLWFTGEGFGTLNGSVTSITEKDQENLIDYLDSGGKLYLSGRDAGEKIEETKFYNEYLNTNFISEIDENEGKRKSIIIGQEGTIFERNNYISYDNSYADIIEPFDEKGKIVMSYGNTGTFYNSYMYSGGTSMATPYVSGLAALLYSLGEKDILSLKSLIMTGANPIIGLEDKILTGAMINASNSINKYLDNDTIYVRGIDLGVEELELDPYINKEYIFKPNIFPADSNDKRVRWVSSNEDIVVIDQEGRLEAINSGQATIKALTIDGGYMAKCNIIVNDYETTENILDIKTYDLKGNEKQFFEENEKVVVDIELLGNIDTNGKIIFQVKDSYGRPYELQYQDIELTKNKKQSISFKFTCKDELSQQIEVYLWNNIEEMKPFESNKISHIN